MMERQDRERLEGRLGADETLFPEGAPQRHINWQDKGHARAVCGIRSRGERDQSRGATGGPPDALPAPIRQIRDGGELRDGKGAQIKMGKDSEPLREEIRTAFFIRNLNTLKHADGPCVCAERLKSG